ncbi:MAG: SRPBCC family protein [Calditrichae bacterium]|nr:SRPBCC family protein [Calditrichota bacterium]MCB9057553.1 SRPBCC family protein [Calditrichia bacterium]
MKILVGILIFLAIVVGIIAIIPSFIDPEATVTRSIEVEKPVEVVYSITKDYNQYLKWNPWSKLDRNARHEITGPVGEVGSKWAWEGNPDSIGTGSLTIEELVQNQAIKSKLEFIVPPMGTAQDLWYFKAIDSTKTSVTWTVAMKADSYFKRYFNIGAEKFLGPTLEQGLGDLKGLIESMPAQTDTLNQNDSSVLY